MKAAIIIAAVAAIACGKNATAPRNLRLGVMTPGLQDLARQACSGPPRTETSEMARHNLSAWPHLVDRLHDKQLVQLSCESRASIRLISSLDDGSIYQLMIDTVTKEEASQWIDALEKAGMDPVLVAGGRKELATRRTSGDGKLGGTDTADGALSFEAKPVLDAWDLSGFVSQ